MKALRSVLAGLLVVGVSFLSGASARAAQVYEIDAVHSSIDFSVAHLVVSKTTGNFGEFSGAIAFDAKDLATSKFDVDIKVASINTRNEARDNHLRGADFFNAEGMPLITLRSKEIVFKGGDLYHVIGDLTMKGVTKPVELPVTIQGPVANPFGGGAVLGVSSSFKVNRQDYGVSWNKVLDNGGVAVGDVVDVSVNFELHGK